LNLAERPHLREHLVHRQRAVDRREQPKFHLF
jgi:hypothetical protein